jgi:protein SCO1/2
MTWLVALALVGDVGIVEHLGAPIPRDLAFTDTTGERVTLGDAFRGKPGVLVMAYARCTMLCNVVLHGIADRVRASALGDDFVPVVVSLDPRETPVEAAKRQARLVEDSGHAWPYLVGDDASIHALADAVGFRYTWDPTTEQYDHPAVVFVLTADGRIAEYVRGVTFDDLDDAIRRAARGAITTSAAADLLRCFHFDPSLHRYGAQIELFLRVGAALILAALAAIVIVLVRWGRRSR